MSTYVLNFMKSVTLNEYETVGLRIECQYNICQYKYTMSVLFSGTPVPFLSVKRTLMAILLYKEEGHSSARKLFTIFFVNKVNSKDITFLPSCHHACPP